MSDWLSRLNCRLMMLRYRWRWIKHGGRELNRRVDVENVLFNVYAGKRPMLTREDCRALAQYLGDPTKKMPVLGNTQER